MTAVPPVPAKSRRKLRRVLGALLIVACAVGGAIGSVAYAIATKPPEVPESLLSAIAPSMGEPIPTLDTAVPAVRIDTLIRAGCFAEALARCRQAPRNTFGSDERPLAYREALCLEGLGHWKDAREAYRRAEADANISARARAILGLARCAIAEESFASARELVDRVLLYADHPDCLGSMVYEEGLYIRARLAILELGRVPALDPLDPDALAWPSLHVGADQYLDWLPTDFVPVSPSADRARNTAATSAVEELQQVLALAPEHPAAASMRVTLANLDIRAGRVRAAATAYKNLLGNSGNSSDVICAAYNLGLLELKQGNTSRARTRFMEVIDRAPGTRWADLSWCWVARTHLDDENLELARSAYHNALGGKSREAASAAALGLCACELLSGDNDAARSALHDHRISTREAHARLAAFFESLLRYRTAPTASRRELLLTALQSADEGRWFGPAGVYLAGRVYRELGLGQQMCALYDAATESVRGPLALCMMFDSADWFDQLNLHREARTRYLALAAADPEGFGTQAELRLAKMDNRDGRGVEAVRRCRAIENRPGVVRADVLAAMGRGYELQGKYRLAAECFAGRMPNE